MEHVKGIPGKPKDELLVNKEKYIVPLLSVLNPVFAGLSFYYGWRNAFQKKPKLPTTGLSVYSLLNWRYMSATDILLANLFM
jgi:hypothetical protein